MEKSLKLYELKAWGLKPGVKASGDGPWPIWYYLFVVADSKKSAKKIGANYLENKIRWNRESGIYVEESYEIKNGLVTKHRTS